MDMGMGIIVMGMGIMRSRIRFRVSGFRFQISDFRFQVSGWDFLTRLFNSKAQVFKIDNNGKNFDYRRGRL